MPWDQIVRGVISGTSRDGLSAEEYLDREIELLRAADTGSTVTMPKRPRSICSIAALPTDGVYPRKALAERTAAAFLGDSDPMCPVPPASVRSLDARRLRIVRQHLLGRDLW